MSKLPLIALVAAGLALPGAGASGAGLPAPTSAWPGRGPHTTFIGSIHNHTAYSDGVGRPEDAFAAGRELGVNFFFVTEHSEWHEFPFRASETCITQPATLPECYAPPPTGRTQWQDVRDQGRIASDTSVPYLGLRGFEWSSPTLGHVNVLLSEHAIGHGPFSPTMDGFWEWFLLDEGLGGGGDGLAIFNHPSREDHPVSSLRTFEDFRYVPDADPRVVGVEIFNRTEDYSSCFVRALHKGWHVGAIGAADNHDTWGRPDRSVTALVVPGKKRDGLTEDAVREALEARRFYATFDHGLRVSFKADGSWMGARLERLPGRAVTLSVAARDDDPIRRIEIYDSSTPEPVCDRDLRHPGGNRMTVLEADPLAAVDADDTSASLEARVTPPPGQESWYFAKVIQSDGDVAYTSPIWVRVP